jgi:hypothetical protein
MYESPIITTSWFVTWPFTQGAPELLPELLPELPPELLPELPPELPPELLPELPPELLPELPLVPEELPEVPLEPPEDSPELLPVLPLEPEEPPVLPELPPLPPELSPPVDPVSVGDDPHPAAASEIAIKDETIRPLLQGIDLTLQQDSAAQNESTAAPNRSLRKLCRLFVFALADRGARATTCGVTRSRPHRRARSSQDAPS